MAIGYRPGAGPQRDSGNTAVKDVYQSNNVFINYVPAVTYTAPLESAGGSLIPIGEYVYELVHAAPLIESAGIAAPYDDPESAEEVQSNPADVRNTYGDPSTDAQPPVANPQTDTTGAVVNEGKPIDLRDFSEPINYDENISENYTIRNLSVGAVFPHNIVPQNGLSVVDILGNLQALAENILEPLRAEYPGFRINSGFRKGSSRSQHNRGMACDLQWPGQAAADYTPIAQWMRDNLPFDQLIFEHGKSIWIHVSYNRTLAKQRGAVLTYYPRVSPNYKAGLTNYYA